MNDTSATPTLSEWLGGRDRLADLTDRFYAKVPFDPILGPVFAGMDRSHAAHVASFIDEVFGGPAEYSKAGGSHAGMIAHHLGRALTEAQRRRWFDLMLETVNEAALPDDPEFRAALVGYLEWGTRLAVLNSAPGAAGPAPDAPMPVWGWGPPGGPWQA
jgi:hemoglobin